MEYYKFIFEGINARPPFEIEYFDVLYDKCRNGGQVEGLIAVTFFKLSGLTQLQLREVWNLSSVYK